MPNAETVLTAIRNRGTCGLPLERLYRQMFNPALDLLAYGKIHRNKGAMTPGVTDETVDGTSQAKSNDISELIRQEKYRGLPVRRTYIEKKNSTKRRPLGRPPWSDTLVQEVVRLILEAYYEPQFSNHSHGFRTGRGCHTALTEIDNNWTGTAWYIEGDIKGCFDNIAHEVLSENLAKNIHDHRFLRLIKEAMDAGFLEDWQWSPSLSGTPQGGIISPILANIYLDRLDKFVENTLLPQYNRGEKRRINRPYRSKFRLYQYYRAQGRMDKARDNLKLARHTPTLDTHDPEYRRLQYIRYADDFLRRFAGPKEAAEEIKRQIGQFLRDQLNLERSEEKTVITHARPQTARFLGYDIKTTQAHSRITKSSQHRRVGSRAAHGTVALLVPKDVVREKMSRYRRHGKPVHRKELTRDSVYTIIAHYAMEYRGIAEYYKLAQNRSMVLKELQGVMQTSLLKTLAHQLTITAKQVRHRYATKIEPPDGERAVIQTIVEREGTPPLVATWGSVSLRRQSRGKIKDEPQRPYDQRVELLERMLADECELCGSTTNVQVHHIKPMKTLQQYGRKDRPHGVGVMASRQRKTLVLCQTCHCDVHNGHIKRALQKHNTGEPDGTKASSPVRRGADGKVPTWFSTRNLLRGSHPE
jgi:group II intron reverse transcriptase/maturase